MANKDKPSFRQSFSSGWNAIVKDSRANFILCHQLSSKYHQEGEKQEILLEQVVLGRAEDCHVRFDESFSTVSRHHAQIVRKEGRWILVQLSLKNSTFLNGKPIMDTWYLQNGDEIQLALNGPKLLFLIPEERIEWKLTDKLSAFKDQVIRPYKSAMVAISISIVLLLALCVVGGVYIHNQGEFLKESSEQIKKQEEQIRKQEEQIVKQKQQINTLYEQVVQANEDLEATALLADAANEEAIKAKSQVFKAKAEAIKSQENLKDVEEQMKKLREEMDDFYNSIINGE